ncbi:MAG: MgtC/SapB family protein [Candidatus Binatus sp.]|uniref:MgtC/SapB family protein n=1 Tax=Candidatus Binatus sp. TaxID=2811406 RepID=UPI003C71AC17
MFSASVAPFAYVDAASKIALAVAVGLLVGLEREWAQKAVGVRTFAIIALLGTLTYLVAPQLEIAALCGTFLLVILLNVHHLLKSWQFPTADTSAPAKVARESAYAIDRDAPLEITTSAALLVTLMLGALIGQGHYFTAITSAIVMTMLLAWKEGLSRFAGGLQPEEIRSAVLLGLLTFVIYPLLPDRFIDPMDLLNPRQSWLIVVVIAGLGFANYVMLRFYGTRGTYYAAFLGGLVNSTAAATELSGLFRGVNNSSLAVAVVMVTSVAMFLRNLVILAIFAPAAVGTALFPLLAMTIAALCAVWVHRDRDGASVSPLSLSSPVSMPHVLKFAALFVTIAAAGTLAERYFGTLGFLALSVLGGLVSSASTTATAATLVAAGRITPDSAGIAVVLTSMASAVVDMPIVYRQIRDNAVFYRLAGVSVLVLIVGLGVMTLGQSESHEIQRLTLQTIQSLRAPAQ